MSPSHHALSFCREPGGVMTRPVPTHEVSIRQATAADLGFIDALQKLHSHAVGWMPTKQLENYVSSSKTLVAVDNQGRNVGYSIAQDRYLSRDECGIVYQLNVAPVLQRHLIGARLLETVFQNASYGCRLFSCWCAQDLPANHFWEAMGFVPLAFRTGSRNKQRIHIFWQRRIRHGDTSTPYWFPSETRAGAVGEARLVLPIPPGTAWQDAKPAILPGLQSVDVTQPMLPAGKRQAPVKQTTSHKIAIVRSKSRHLCGQPAGTVAVVTKSGIRYIERGDHEPEPKAKRERSNPRPKNNPQHVAACRELRDRYLEAVNAANLLPAAKYDIAKLPDESSVLPVLPAGVGCHVLEGSGDIAGRLLPHGLHESQSTDSGRPGVDQQRNAFDAELNRLNQKRN